MSLPSLFLSHGAPDLSLHALPAREFLQALGTRYDPPRAIIVASAHYDDPTAVCVTADAAPRTIHDFGGFDPRLYQMHYRAPGAPDLAREIVAQITQAGLSAKLDSQWGFDHGTWVPLALMYPTAEIPVIAISINSRASPAYHLQLGRALSALTAQGILIIGSGAFTHNLSAVAPPAGNTQLPPWIDEFANWTAERLATSDEASLLNYRTLAPHAARNHPSDEHFMPLYVAMGAAGEDWSAERLHTSVTYGCLRMDTFAFHAAA